MTNRIRTHLHVLFLCLAIAASTMAADAPPIPPLAAEPTPAPASVPAPAPAPTPATVPTERIVLSDGRVLVGIYDETLQTITARTGSISAHIPLGSATIVERQPAVPTTVTTATTASKAPIVTGPTVESLRRKIADLASRVRSYEQSIAEPYKPERVIFGTGGNADQAAAEARRYKSWANDRDLDIKKVQGLRQQSADLEQQIRAQEQLQGQADVLATIRDGMARRETRTETGDPVPAPGSGNTSRPGNSPTSAYPGLDSTAIKRYVAIQSRFAQASTFQAAAVQEYHDAHAAYENSRRLLAEQVIVNYPTAMVPIDAHQFAGLAGDAQATLIRRLNAYNTTMTQIADWRRSRDAHVAPTMSAEGLLNTLLEPQNRAISAAAGKPAIPFD